MRVDSIIQQRQEKRIPNSHVARHNNRDRQPRRHTHGVPRHNAPRRPERHNRNQRQENRRRQTAVIRDTALHQHDDTGTTQCDRPHQPDPPQHVRQDREPESPRRTAGKRDLRNEREVRDSGCALVRDLFDLIEGFAFHVRREGEETGDSQQGEGGEEDEVEDEHYGG